MSCWPNGYRCIERAIVPKYAMAGTCLRLPSSRSPHLYEFPTADGRVNDAHLWHPWLRINRVLRVMLRTHWSPEAWSQVRVEFRRALALRSEIRRAGWFN
jgi:hypothetical protein